MALMDADCQAPGMDPGDRPAASVAPDLVGASLRLRLAWAAPRWPRLEIMKPRRTAIATPIAVHPDLSGLSPYRSESYLELVCVPRWNASSLTFSVRSICVNVRAIES